MADSTVTNPSPYSGCCAIVTTKHAKSVAIAPAFWQRLGMTVLEYPVDTDLLGTFSGEIERQGNALECARRKCEMGLEMLGVGAEYGLASEGMRAYMNPSRMSVIGELADKMAQRLATACPDCSAPGWGSIRSEKGLHCEYCDQETQMISHEIYGCVLCNHTKKQPRTDGLKAAPQMHCGWCNP